MSSSINSETNGETDSFKQKYRTYTPQSHEEPLRFSKNSVTSEDVNSLKRENEHLKEELNYTYKRFKKLNEKLMIMEKDKNEGKVDKRPFLQSKTDIKTTIKSEIELNTDDRYAKSWEVLQHHFSEVIRKHNEVLAEKDRQIKELQDIRREISFDYIGARDSFRKNKRKLNGIPKNKTSPDNSTDSEQSLKYSNLENDETGSQGRNKAGPSEKYRCDDGCTCPNASVHGGDVHRNSMSSGTLLREHFSEVMRRHTQQLQERDRQLREAREALDYCLERKPPKPCSRDYYDPSQPHTATHHRVPTASSTPRSSKVYARDSGPSDSSTGETSSDEEGGSLLGSADTFVALDKCQRLETIHNLEKLRQQLIKRLELEEKLDKLYWQMELKRYGELREQVGDSFDPDGSFNEEFEMLESTRLELLRALKDVKDPARKEPEMYIKPCSPVQDNDNKRQVTFTEEDIITPLETTYSQ